MHQLAFRDMHCYADARDGVSLPVRLRSGERSVHLAASLDTGAAFCLFRSEVAEELGIQLSAGSRQRFRKANSFFEAYGHELEIDVLGIVTYSTAYFFADPSINKNVLGRAGWLDRVQLGLIHHTTASATSLRTNMPPVSD